MKISPRSSSTDIVDQTLTPVRCCQASAAHVSCPASPGCGTVWNRHRSWPLWTSKARTSPDGPRLSPSGTRLPTITRSRKIAGADVTPYSCPGPTPRPLRKSTEPRLPKAERGCPVLASSAIRCPSHVPEKMVASAVDADQTATPRCGKSQTWPLPANGSKRHASVPVSASSAITLLVVVVTISSPPTSAGRV